MCGSTSVSPAVRIGLARSPRNWSPVKPDVIFAQEDARRGRGRETGNLDDPDRVRQRLRSDRRRFVASLARPGGSITGMQLFEASIAGKWLAMLKEIEPGLKRAALMANPKTTAYDYFLRIVEAAAPSLALDVIATRVEGAERHHPQIEALAKEKDAGLVLVARTPPICAIATSSSRSPSRHRIPVVYPEPQLRGRRGGSLSYGIADLVEPFRQVGILRGSHPGAARSRRTCRCRRRPATPPRSMPGPRKALGLDLSPTLLLRADEVIE